MSIVNFNILISRLPLTLKVIEGHLYIYLYKWIFKVSYKFKTFYPDQNINLHSYEQLLFLLLDRPDVEISGERNIVIVHKVNIFFYNTNQ